MKVNIIRIGNSQGIRIPKPLLEQCHLGKTVELEVRNDHLAVLPARRARSGWADAFREMAAKGDDALLDKDTMPATKWERAEWEW
jgi:antitoxin MazE